ncbi:MAG: RNA polymerase sigma factor (sigma-70 family) [Verrucomicrobiales bacterium]
MHVASGSLCSRERMSDALLQTRTIEGQIPTTRWSIIRAAGGDATQRRQALEVFAGDYWPAIYAFARRRGSSPQEAEDLTQGFLVSLIERDSLATVAETGDRFRCWLLGALKNYLKIDWRNRNRLKRGGGIEHLSIDRDLGEAWLESTAGDEESPDAAFERRWAWGILERALVQLTAMYRRNGREEIARVLAPTVMGGESETTYEEAAAELGISRGNARVLAFRLRKHLKELVRDEVAQTVGSTGEIDDELEHFFRAFSGG